MIRHKTYYARTCHKVAKELNMHPQEVKVIVRYFFKSLRRSMSNYSWVAVKGFFKFKLTKKMWRWAVAKGHVEPEFANYKN